MKKLIFVMVVVASGLILYSCNENSQFISADSLKTNINELVASDSQVENVVETSNYEADVFSLGNNSLSAIAGGLKSGEIGGDLFKNMFERFPNFKLRYQGGIMPDLTITSTNGGFPRTMTISYGDGLRLTNGHVLKGKIIVVLSAAPFTSGSTRTVTFDNFCADSVCISGTIVKTRTKDVTPKFYEKSDMTISHPNGTTIHRVEEKVKSWLAGVDTEFNPADDVVEIAGKIEFSDSKGNGFSKIITTPLVKTGVCKFITKGVIEYKTNSGKFATINYGNGDCDNKATRTTLNGTTEITLGK